MVFIFCVYCFKKFYLIFSASFLASITACAAANVTIGTLKGKQETFEIFILRKNLIDLESLPFLP